MNTKQCHLPKGTMASPSETQTQCYYIACEYIPISLLKVDIESMHRIISPQGCSALCSLHQSITASACSHSLKQISTTPRNPPLSHALSINQSQIDSTIPPPLVFTSTNSSLTLALAIYPSQELLPWFVSILTLSTSRSPSKYRYHSETSV